MNILITGGAGFVGLNLVHYLRQHPAVKVRVLDDFSLGKPKNLEGLDVEVITGNIKDVAMVSAAMENIDAVVHLAAHTRVIESIEDPSRSLDDNIGGTFVLLDAARKSGVKGFVMASTGGAILGDAVPPVHEEMVPRPLSPYGASKLAGEGLCSAFAGSYGLGTCALRFSNVYGPYSFHKGSVVAHFFKQILNREKLIVYGDGTQLRDYVFSQDLCAAIFRAVTETRPGSCYQLGTGIGTSINELIAEMKKVVGPNYAFDVEYRPARAGEVQHTYADISLARRELDYDPATALGEGLVQTWNWMKGVSETGGGHS